MKRAPEILTTLRVVFGRSFSRDVMTLVNLDVKRLEDIGKK